MQSSFHVNPILQAWKFYWGTYDTEVYKVVMRLSHVNQYPEGHRWVHADKPEFIKLSSGAFVWRSIFLCHRRIYLTNFRAGGVPYWIGLWKTSLVASDDAHWLDNSSSGYRDWYKGNSSCTISFGIGKQPSNASHCVLRSQGCSAWIVYDCNYGAKYICKISGGK